MRKVHISVRELLTANYLPDIRAKSFVRAKNEDIVARAFSQKEGLAMVGVSRFLYSRAQIILTIWVIAVATVIVSSAVAAESGTPAESFIQDNVQKGLAILNNHSIPDVQRRAEFGQFLTSLTDLKRIALFTLGDARQTASAADVEEFVSAFQDYAKAVYESRLSSYSNQGLRVTGSSEPKPGDFVVSTELVDPSGTANGQKPLDVEFRVVAEKGSFIVVDIGIFGVWLTLEQRNQFVSFLGHGENDVHALASRLRGLASQLRDGG